ncbi:MAG TPA: HDOD domain-containing protein [Rhodothermales bacterium]|nr:HDOD domain-containing protein [Rhodothermales bacterium]
MKTAAYKARVSARATLGSLDLRFPPLPQTLVEAMNLMEKPEHIEIGPVTEMVQRDPVVIARLLHIVNSAYYGLRHSISSAERAVLMLGPVAVTGIVVGMNMLKLKVGMDESGAQCVQKLIRHSVATAFLTRHLLEGPPREYTPEMRKASVRVGVSFTAGLLHDFGKIILVYNHPREAVEFYHMRALDLQVADQDARQLEQLLFGYDHVEAGEFVARKLNFPDLLTDVIRLHHDPESLDGREEKHRVLRATCAANLASKALGYGFTSTLDWEAVGRNPVWDLMARYDLRQHGDARTIMDDIKNLHEHLEHYVSNMLA